MSIAQSLYQRYKRHRTLQTDLIQALPVVILMPHSACNCRCVMCDIWKDNKNLKQLTIDDISGLLGTLKKFGTQQVVMSGGEALLNPNFYRFCEMLKEYGIKVTLLSTGLTLARNSELLATHVRDIIVSLDGDESTHDNIRNIPGAFQKLREGIAAIRHIAPNFPIAGRSVIHRHNFRKWAAIVDSAHDIELDSISFLPADVGSHAFNREVLWSEKRQHEILPDQDELDELKKVAEALIISHSNDFASGFVAENPAKLMKIYYYYTAIYGINPFPYKKCNAPWVSTVVEADGTVRPCFFHAPIGNIKAMALDKILNSEEAINFRKQLDMANNSTCIKCVCHLHLSPGTKLN